MEKREHLCAAGGDAEWYIPRRTARSFLKTPKVEQPRDPGAPLPDTCPKELRAESQRHLHTQAHAACFSRAKWCEQANVHPQMMGTPKVVSPYSGVPVRLTQKDILTQPPIQINLEDIRPRETSRTQRALYHLTPRVQAVDVMETECSEQVGGGGAGRGGWSLMGTELQFGGRGSLGEGGEMGAQS